MGRSGVAGPQGGRVEAADRRRDPRIRVVFQVLSVHPPLEGVALLTDASARGACLGETPARPQSGQAVHLTVRLPGRRLPLDLVGTVVRPTGDGFAVEFEKPVPEFVNLVAEEPIAVVGPAVASPEAAAAPAPKRAGLVPFQQLAVEWCASNQWISGQVCLPLRRTLLDHLNQGESFLRVIDVITPHDPAPMAFIAVRSDAIDLVVPAEGQQGIDPPQRVGSFVRRGVRVLLPYADIEGSLDVLERIRVSDHLMRCGNFVALHDARVRLARGQRAPRDLSRVPILIVNARRVLGVSDLAASPPPPDEPGDGPR